MQGVGNSPNGRHTFGVDSSSLHGVNDRLASIARDRSARGLVFARALVERVCTTIVGLVTDFIFSEGRDDVQLSTICVRIFRILGCHFELSVAKATEFRLELPKVRVQGIEVFMHDLTNLAQFGGVPHTEEDKDGGAGESEEEKSRGDPPARGRPGVLLGEPGLFYGGPEEGGGMGRTFLGSHGPATSGIC